MPGLELVQAGAGAGADVVSAVLYLPRVGAWTAELEVAAAVPLAGRVDLLIDDTRWVGTVARGAMVEGLFRAQLVAGANGLRTKVAPRHYNSPTIAVVLRDLVKDAGEAISPTADSAVLGTQLDFWTTLQMPFGQALRCLLEDLPAQPSWRHLPDGTIWIGADTFEDSGIEDFAEISEQPEHGTVQVQLVSPLVYPGTLLGGRRVDSAQVRVTGSEVRATIWLAP